MQVPAQLLPSSSQVGLLLGSVNPGINGSLHKYAVSLLFLFFSVFQMSQLTVCRRRVEKEGTLWHMTSKAYCTCHTFLLPSCIVLQTWPWRDGGVSAKVPFLPSSAPLPKRKGSRRETIGVWRREAPFGVLEVRGAILEGRGEVKGSDRTMPSDLAFRLWLFFGETVFRMLGCTSFACLTGFLRSFVHASKMLITHESWLHKLSSSSWIWVHAYVRMHVYP